MMGSITFFVLIVVGDDFFFFSPLHIAVGRDVVYSDFERDPYFFWRRQNYKLAFISSY